MKYLGKKNCFFLHFHSFIIVNSDYQKALTHRPILHCNYVSRGHLIIYVSCHY